MPTVATVERRPVGQLEGAAAGDRLEHPQVAGGRLMPSGEQAIDDTHPALRRDDELGPPRSGMHGPVVGGNRLQRPHHRRANGHHAPAGGMRRVDQSGRRRRHPVALGVRRLVGLQRGHAGVQHDRGDDDAVGDEIGDDLCRHDAPGRRHLRRTRLDGEGVGVGVQRPRVGHVPVPDRASEAVEVLEQRCRQRQRGDPQADGSRHASEDPHAPAAGQGERLAGMVAGIRRRRAVDLRAADLDEVEVGRQLGRQVHDDGTTVSGRGVDGGGDRG